MPAVIMYCTRTCPYCQRAEKLLRKRGARVEKIRVDGNPAKLREMIRRSRRKTVPQIFIGDRHVGGFDDIAELDILDKLAPMIKGAG